MPLKIVLYIIEAERGKHKNDFVHKCESRLSCEFFSPVLQQEFQHHWTHHWILIHRVIERRKSLRQEPPVLSWDQQPSNHNLVLHTQTVQVHTLQTDVPLMWGSEQTSTIRRDNRWSMMCLLGGVLSLKHTVETRSMKKALHLILNNEFWLMRPLMTKTSTQSV